MSASVYKARHGLPGEQVKMLSEHWLKKKLADSDFASKDDFIKWSAESGFQPYARLRRYDDNEPHGPDNSHWYVKPDYQPVPKKDCTSTFCMDCTGREGCELGCKEWREWFVKNWNKNICRKPKAPERPLPRLAFRYEHPDMVKRGACV